MHRFGEEIQTFRSLCTEIVALGFDETISTVWLQESIIKKGIKKEL